MIKWYLLEEVFRYGLRNFNRVIKKIDKDFNDNVNNNNRWYLKIGEF